jgi:hypothetical protein
MSDEDVVDPDRGQPPRPFPPVPRLARSDLRIEPDRTIDLEEPRRPEPHHVRDHVGIV